MVGLNCQISLMIKDIETSSRLTNSTRSSICGLLKLIFYFVKSQITEYTVPIPTPSCFAICLMPMPFSRRILIALRIPSFIFDGRPSSPLLPWHVVDPPLLSHESDYVQTLLTHRTQRTSCVPMLNLYRDLVEETSNQL